MYIEINDQTTLKDIQQAFSNFYPYLKLEFYRSPHKKYEPSPDVAHLSREDTLSNILHTHVSGLLEIRPMYKVAEVEREFQQRFGIAAQILIQERKSWRQTTGMDDFTLKELNEISRSYSDSYILEDANGELGGEA
jgi:glycerol-3-phosphate O-acyltransferase